MSDFFHQVLITVKKRWKSLFCIFFIILLSCIAMASLATPGLFTSHDNEAHIKRLIQFHQALNDGQFPPRWGSGFFGGIGSPVLLLNYQLPYFVADFFVRVGLSFFDAFKLTLALSYLFSGIFAFVAFQTLYGTLAGITGAILYTWVPYRFVDVYVRAAFGESFAFVFPPLILFGITRASLLITTLGFAGLFLSHPVASAMFTPFFLGYILLQYGLVQPNVARLKKLLLAFVFAFALASFNIIPTLTLTKYTHYIPSSTGPLEHFPSLRQLTLVTWGYAGSTPNNEHELMSYHIGYAHLITILIATIALVYISVQRQQKKSAIIPTFVLVCSGIVFFLMQKISIPIWKFLHLTLLFDFPWRMLLYTAFSVSFLAAWTIGAISKPIRIGIMLFLITIAIRSNLNHININAIWPWGIEHYMNDVGTGDAYGEFASLTRITQNESRISQRVEVLKGQANITYEKNISQYLVAHIHAETTSRVRVNIMHFPGWEYVLDDKKVELNKQCALSSYDGPVPPPNEVVDNSGLLECLLEPGKHRLIADFKTPNMQMLGNLISLAGLGALLWNLYQSYFQHTMKRQISSRLQKK